MAEKWRDESGAYNVECEECGRVFQSTRFDATYCGATCRSRARRRAEKTQRLHSDAEQAIDALIAILPRRLPIDAKSKAQITLGRLKSRIEAALGSIESDFS